MIWSKDIKIGSRRGIYFDSLSILGLDYTIVYINEVSPNSMSLFLNYSVYTQWIYPRVELPRKRHYTQPEMVL